MGESGYPALTVGVLGSLEVAVDGRPVAVTSGRLRTLLAVLAMSAGRAVSVERLTDALWDEDPPDKARRAVQTYITRLRGALSAEAIGTGPTGYLLRTDPDRVDALRFTRLLDGAATAPDLPARRALLRQALALWRGTPFDGLRSPWLEHTEAPRLVERYLAAVERMVDQDIACGRHSELVARLQELATRHPHRESLWVRLLIVLDRCGRQAEALERYETIRVRLAEALGVDPGPELQQVYTNLLAGRPPPPAGGTELVAAEPAVPRQLPADVNGFIGREAALAALDGLLDGGRTRAASAVVIAAIAGTAGVGKTALAIHWAHRVAYQFPDGQLHVNLRGYHPSAQAMAPGDAVRGFLDALGVPPQRIPADPDAQESLYRSLLAGKRVLVVLDNARDADQVRPLLPGSPTCLVIVTSRDQLTSLVATEAAHASTLDLFTAEEARELLASRLGADRLAAEPWVADELIERCARLPLALAIAAALAAARPSFSLQALVIHLRNAQSSLDVLSTGDAVTDVRAVFSWSYHALGADAARLFRWLGLHPGPDISTPAAASTAGVTPVRARRLLAELTRASLVTEHVPGRYAMHDLLRRYASELAHIQESEADRMAALARILDHYLHTASAGSRILNPDHKPVPLTPCRPGVSPEDLDDSRRALAWFGAEHAVLLASIAQAVGHRFDVQAYQLVRSVAAYLRIRGHWRDWATTQLAALEATQRLGDADGQAFAHRGLGAAYVGMWRAEDALVQLRRALEIYVELGDAWGRATTHLNLGGVFERQGRHAAALDQARQALWAFESIDDRAGQARAANSVGWCHARLGDYPEAIVYCQRALNLTQQCGARVTESHAWDSLGYIHHQLGQPGLAITSYKRALDLRRESGDHRLEAATLVHLGDAQLAAGDQDSAQAAWREAMRLVGDRDLRTAADIRARLHSL